MITISKIAKLANVSVSTASKAFSGSREVNEKTREIIFDIAKKYGVFKKFYNAKYPHIVIAVVIPEYYSGNYSVLISEIQKELNERDCTMIVTAADFLEEKNETLLDYYSNYTDADGIIIVDGNIDIPDDFSTPCVVIGNTTAKTVPLISINIEKALDSAIEYFKKCGVESVGFISEMKTAIKLEKFKKAMEKIYGGYDENSIVTTNCRFEESGYEAITKLIKAGKLPRALIVGYDNIAYGAMRALKECGLSVPDDVALVGFDDNPMSKYMAPSLSSIDIKKEECAKAAVEIILNKIFALPYEKNVTIDASFNLRESSVIREKKTK